MPSLGEGFLGGIIIELAAEGLVLAGQGAYGLVKRLVRGKTKGSSAQENLELLQSLGQINRQTIDRLLAEFSRRCSVEEEQLEELRGILVNLTEGSRFVTTQGRTSSIYLRAEHLLDRLLTQLEIVRRKSENVGVGSDWILDTYLGSGGFGEVWTGYNSRLRDREWARAHCRVFKFFTSEEAQQWIQREENGLYELQCKLPSNDPNIITFYGSHVADQKYPYLEFEYSAGGSLEQWL